MAVIRHQLVYDFMQNEGGQLEPSGPPRTASLIEALQSNYDDAQVANDHLYPDYWDGFASLYLQADVFSNIYPLTEIRGSFDFSNYFGSQSQPPSIENGEVTEISLTGSYFIEVDLGYFESARDQVVSITGTSISSTLLLPIFDFENRFSAPAFDAQAVAAAILAGDDTVIGTSIEDTLIGGAGNDTLTGGAGDDTITGGSGADAIDGGAGRDTALFVGSATVDLLNPGASAGEAAGDTFTSVEVFRFGDQVDVFSGSSGSDEAYGGRGNDFLIGRLGADRLDGGDGTDVVVFETQTRLDLSNRATDTGEAKGDLYTSIESFSFRAGRDVFIGASGADQAKGGAGNDTFSGHAGNDKLYGEADNDVLDGGAGDDLLDGGDGNDLLTGGAGADALRGSLGTDTVVYVGGAVVNLANPAQSSGEAAGDTWSSIEVFRFGAPSDRFIGDTAANTVYGGGGNDVLDGGAGNDRLTGDDGVDTLTGGLGIDLLTGGARADRFSFAAADGSLDTITDFTAGQDRIAVSRSGFGFTQLRLSSASEPAATTNAGTFLFDTDTGRLSYDANGTGAGGVITVATLTGVTALSASDFLLLA